jgi:hypothetical protein
MIGLLKFLGLVPKTQDQVIVDTTPEPAEYDEYTVTIDTKGPGWRWNWKVTAPDNKLYEGYTDTHWGAKREVQKAIKSHKASVSYTVKVRK